MLARSHGGPRRIPLLLLVLGLAGAGLALVLASRPARASDEPQTLLVITHTFYRSEDGSVAVDEETSEVSAQYLVNAHKWSSTAMPVTVRYNSAGQPAEYGMAGILQEAISTWNAVTPSTFSFVWSGAGSGIVGACGQSISLDGQNTVQFEPLPGVTLGQTCTVWNPTQGANAPLMEFDMRLDADAATWSASDQPQPGRYDIRSTILHELGHAAGLGHSAQSTAVMYPSLASGIAKRTLTADDISGLQAAYPGGGTATPTPSPTSPSSPSPTSTAVAPTTTPGVGTLPQTQPRARTMALARD